MSPSLATATIALPFEPPAKACHNCRKKRWRCDRSLPSCQKCLAAGTECLGYGKLFVWNRGVASRGKLMGREYEHNTGVGTKERPLLIWDQCEETSSQWQQPQESDEQHTAMTVQRLLVDPLVNDLDRDSRYYLHHYATQLCEVLVVYDIPGQNPMRDLIPASSVYPFLLHIIIANSAFHISNITSKSEGQAAYQGNLSPTVSTHYQVSRYGGSQVSSYKDALVAKHHALISLAGSVASVNAINIDIILVTILLFVNYALVESGRDKWKVHMDGALKLIKLLGTPAYLQRPMSRLRQTILSDFLVFHILGSTFTFSSIPGLVPESIELEPILRYAETNNYLSCPGPLLRIMIESFALSNIQISPHVAGVGVPLSIQNQVGSLLQRALAFDPIAWSASFERAAPNEDLSQRIIIASAHRSAVCIYLARVLPSTDPLLDQHSGRALVSLTGLANDVVHHISYLKPGDALFKSICWPLFLAGAESEDKAQRRWILKTLNELYGVLFWGCLLTSKKVLEAIWKFKDESAVGSGNCWVEEVKELGSEILIA